MIVFDTETTGLLQPETAPLSAQPKIIEFAAIKLCDKTLKEVSRMEFLCNPGEKLSAKIIEVTGLTDEDLKDKPGFGHYYPELCDYFLGETYLVAHNLSFDIGMLTNDLRRIGKLTAFPWPHKQICTIEASYGIDNRRLKLGKLHEYATGAAHENAHRAMGDVEALVTCVRWLANDGLIKIPEMAPVKKPVRSRK